MSSHVIRNLSDGVIAISRTGSGVWDFVVDGHDIGSAMRLDYGHQRGEWRECSGKRRGHIEPGTELWAFNMRGMARVFFARHQQAGVGA